MLQDMSGKSFFHQIIRETTLVRVIMRGWRQVAAGHSLLASRRPEGCFLSSLPASETAGPFKFGNTCRCAPASPDVRLGSMTQEALRVERLVGYSSVLEYLLCLAAMRPVSVVMHVW